MDDTLDLVNALASAGVENPQSAEKSSQMNINVFSDVYTPPRENSGYVDAGSWNMPPSRSGKGVGKGKGSAPPTPPGRLPSAMPPAMSIPRATGAPTPESLRHPVAQAYAPPSNDSTQYMVNNASNIGFSKSSPQTPERGQSEAHYLSSRQQQFNTLQSNSVPSHGDNLNPFIDYGDEVESDDIVFITESPERKTSRYIPQQHPSNQASFHSTYQNEMRHPSNDSSGGGGGWAGRGGGGNNSSGGGPGGWWRNMRNRNSDRNSEVGQSGGYSEPEVNRVSLRTSMSTVALDGTGELLLSTGEGGDGSELGMVREDQPHLVVSLLQARNMIPPNFNGRLIQKFTAYFVVNYGGFERKSTHVHCPSGAAMYDQHMVFPAIGEETDLVFSLMSKGNLVDKCVATLTISVPPIFGKRASRTARASLESLGGFGVVLESEQGAKMNSPLCHAEWFPLDSASAQPVLAEINLSLTPTFFRQLPSILEVSKTHREERCRVVREVEDLTTHCISTELLPIGQSSEVVMSSSSAALFEEMRSLRQEVWGGQEIRKAVTTPGALVDIDINTDMSSGANAAPLNEATNTELKAYFAVLLSRVRKHVNLMSSNQRANKPSRQSMASVQAINKQLSEITQKKSLQVTALGEELASTKDILLQLLEAMSSESDSLEKDAESALKDGRELWSLTVHVKHPNDEETQLVVRLTPDHKVIHVLALVNSQLPKDKFLTRRVISLSKQNGALLSLSACLRTAVSPGSTLHAQFLNDEASSMPEDEPLLEESLETTEEAAASDELAEVQEEVLRMRRELSTWMKAQKQWAVKESELVNRLEASEKEKTECSAALAQARTVTSKMEALCSELSQRVKVAEGKASRTSAALDNVLAQLSTERSSANANEASFEAERREMLAFIEASLDPKQQVVQRVDADRRQRELQRRVAVEDSRQHQMSQHMGMGPILSPEKERQLRESTNAWHEALHQGGGGGAVMTSEDYTGGGGEEEEPETLKEYYEQKRKLRERSMRLGKLEVGPDGLLVAREKKKGPLRMNHNPSQSSPSNIDWSGY